MKLTLREIPVFSLAFIRMAIAAVVICILTFDKLSIKKSDIKMMVLAGLCGVTFNIAFFFLGLKLAPAINAALLAASIPILTLVAANIYLKEKLSLRLLLAAVTATIGVFVIIGLPTTANTVQFFGNILLLISALFWVFYEIISKNLFKKYNSSTVTFYTMTVGTITFAPFAFYELWHDPNWVTRVTMSGWLGVLYGIFFASLVAYWAWQTGLSKMQAGKASFFFYLDPISGAILAVLLLGEAITTQLIVGTILITLGVIFAEFKRKSHPLYK